jgi:hypothetical protein
LHDPHVYLGLYVYDFGTHVAVGYTAAEVLVLRQSKEFSGGKAYQIYRVGEGGSIELRGVLDERLHAREAMCFLRGTADAARRDYEELRSNADRRPVSAPVELLLVQRNGWTPPHVTAMTYPAANSHAVAQWLNEAAFSGGDDVVGGLDVYRELMQAPQVIESCRLRSRINYQDRPAAEVLRSTHEPVQR